MKYSKVTTTSLVVFLVGVIGFAANFTSVLTWLGYTPTKSYPSFELTLSCNNNNFEIPSSASSEELQHLQNFFAFVELHNEEVVQLSFALPNNGAGACARIDDQKGAIPNYHQWDGAIFISEFDAGPIYHSGPDQQFISAAIDNHVLQISGYWPDIWGRGQVLILPQLRELRDLSGYSFGDHYCTRCFSGLFEVRSLSVPAANLYAVRALRS